MDPVVSIAWIILIAIAVFAVCIIAERSGAKMPPWWRTAWRTRMGLTLLVLGATANLGLMMFS
jgi:hypothetical protein